MKLLRHKDEFVNAPFPDAQTFKVGPSDPRLAEYLKEYPPPVFSERLYQSIELLERYSVEVAIDLAGRLTVGRIHANGRGFIPYIRRDLYAKIVAAAGGVSPGDQALAQAAAAGRSSDSASPSSGELPPSWDAIAAGHVVIAQDEPTEGWYEAVVVETNSDMLTLRWRDYPRERRFSRHKFSVALMYPHHLPAVDPKTVSMPSQPAKAKSAPKGAAEPKAVYPKTWDEIDVDCLVLCKEDGPWRSWWEAIPIAKSDHMFLVRWRDFPQVPNITRPRWTLGLLYPNGR